MIHPLVIQSKLQTGALRVKAEILQRMADAALADARCAAEPGARYGKRNSKKNHGGVRNTLPRGAEGAFPGGGAPSAKK